MWVFLPYGFFSVVQDWNEPDTLMWRTRCRRDALMLVQEHGLRTEVIETPDFDYPFRLRIPKAESGQIMASATQGIDYGNFKKRVGTHSAQRAWLYHRVYGILQGATDTAPNEPAGR